MATRRLDLELAPEQETTSAGTNELMRLTVSTGELIAGTNYACTVTIDMRSGTTVSAVWQVQAFVRVSSGGAITVVTSEAFPWGYTGLADAPIDPWVAVSGSALIVYGDHPYEVNGSTVIWTVGLIAFGGGS